MSKKPKDDLDRARRRAAIIAGYKEIFLHHPIGKKILLDMIKAHHVMSPTMDENPRVMIHREGERNVVLRILRLIETDAEAILQRIREAEEQQATD